MKLLSVTTVKYEELYKVQKTPKNNNYVRVLCKIEKLPKMPIISLR